MPAGSGIGGTMVGAPDSTTGLPLRASRVKVDAVSTPDTVLLSNTTHFSSRANISLLTALLTPPFSTEAAWQSAFHRLDFLTWIGEYGGLEFAGAVSTLALTRLWGGLEMSEMEGNFTPVLLVVYTACGCWWCVGEW